MAPEGSTTRCEAIPAYPDGDGSADTMAGFLGALVSLYGECALRHDALIEHVRKTNQK